MMLAADTSEDGLIDYAEFEGLFNGCILELARMDAVEKMLVESEQLQPEEQVVFDMGRMLDELMIPMHLAFDLSAEGAESVAADALCDLLRTKCPEWGISEGGVDSLCAALLAGPTPVSWPALVESIEKLSGMA
jgi:hypothetical protein